MITKKIQLAEDDKARNRGGNSAAKDEERALKAIGRGVNVPRGGSARMRTGGRQASTIPRRSSAPRPRHRHLAEWRQLAAYLVEGNPVDGGEREAPGGVGRVGHVSARNIPWHEDESAPVAPGEVEEMFDWMADTASGNVRAAKTAILHYSVSLPTEDANKATPDLWNEYVDRALEGLGLSEHQAIAIEHVDTPNPHIHLVVNRIHPITFKAIDPWWDLAKLEKVNREFERLHRMKVEPGRLINECTFKPRSAKECRPERRKRGQRIDAEQLARQIKTRIGAAKPFSEAQDWSDLEKRLSDHGLQLRASGRGFALIDLEGGGEVKASKIGGKAAGREHLEERFGSTWSAWSELRDEAEAKGVTVEAAREARHQKAEAERAAAKAAKRDRALLMISTPAFEGSHAPYLSPLGINRGANEFDLKEAVKELTADELQRWSEMTHEKHAEAMSQGANGDWHEVVHGTKSALAILDRELMERGKQTSTTTPSGKGSTSHVEALTVHPDDKAGISAAREKVKALSEADLRSLAEATRSALTVAKKGEATPSQAALQRGLSEGMRLVRAEAKSRGVSLSPQKPKSRNRGGWSR